MKSGIMQMMKVSAVWLRLMLCGGMMVLLSNCTQLTIAWTDLRANGAVARPDILAAFEEQEEVRSIEMWEEERAPRLRAALQHHIYGVLPDRSQTRVVARRVLDPAFLEGKAILEEWDIEANSAFGTNDPQTARFQMVLVRPAVPRRAVPVIIMESFCRNHNTVPHQDVSRPSQETFCDGDGIGALAASFIFGRYNMTPPLENIIEHGVAFAALYPGDYVPDNGKTGRAALRRLSRGHEDEATRWGAVAAWGWGYSRVIDALEGDAGIDHDKIILYGHSRYGKAALVGAAFDPRADAVIAHQSGTGGAALNREKLGETISAITRSYPHWFSQKYASYAEREAELPIDQHHLLALIAPRPLLLGNARRDVWSDPNGSFRAAQGASPVWHLYGARGLTTKDLKNYDPQADIAFHMRPGTHGTTQEDWPAFLEFIDAHFGEQKEG